jgi:hypothetical protein
MRMAPKAAIWLLVVLALSLGGGLFAGVFEESNPSSPVLRVFRTSAVPTEEEQVPRPRRVADPIDGQPVSQIVADRLPIGVIIDNHPEARAQWGLSFAARVYEALTEGGITRYLVIFGREDVDRVGPVRSARTQFLGYALELHAALAHVGGNEDALALIAASHLRNLDEFRYAGAYRRIFKPRIAYEHTMFTSTNALRAAAEQNGRSGDVSIGHPIWKADAPLDQRPMHQRVTIDFSIPAYKVSWVYRRTTNDYQRILAGTVDTDAATSKAISARSIAIAVIKRTHGRTRIGEDTWAFADIGAGDAWVVQDGTVTQGTWHKTSPADRLRFLDQTGQEIAFDSGPQWVEIIPPEVARDVQKDLLVPPAPPDPAATGPRPASPLPAAPGAAAQPIPGPARSALPISRSVPPTPPAPAPPSATNVPPLASGPGQRLLSLLPWAPHPQNGSSTLPNVARSTGLYQQRTILPFTGAALWTPMVVGVGLIVLGLMLR